MACSPSKICLSAGIGGLGLLIFGILTGWVIVPRVVRMRIAEYSFSPLGITGHDIHMTNTLTIVQSPKVTHLSTKRAQCTLMCVIGLQPILPLKPNTESWDRWENLPVPIQYRVFVFNVNNPNEILEGKKPNVSEVGPYIYKERRVKTMISVDPENSNAVYEHKFVFEFDAEASAPLREDDVLTVVNSPAMLFGLIVDNLKAINPVIKLFNTSLKKMWPAENPIFIKAKVKDYLFGGLPILCNQSKALENLDVEILCEAFRILHPKTAVLDDVGKNIHSFSYFRYKNDTSDGIYKVDLGIHDITKIGQILSWNDANTLSVWKGKSCNRILGTDTTVFRPYLEMDNIQSLYIYHTDACRSIKLVYEGDTEYKGVKGRRYVPDKSFLGSVHTDSENYCFCPQSVKEVTHYGGCLHSGVLELSGCQGAPAIISYPHFLMADSIYQNKIEGLNPDKDRHHIYLDLEPNTGYPLRAASRAQINVFLKGIPEVEIMKKLPNILMPTIWLEERVELTDELINTMNSQMLSILGIVDVLKWVMIGSGIVLSVGSCGYYFFKVGRQKGVKTV